jgi:AcrR family transcriptional regulator
MREPAVTEYVPQRSRLTATERRKTILRAARSEFARVGYHGASTASIARIAGKHFAGKLDLFMQALQDAVARTHELFSEFAADGTNVVEQTANYLARVIEDPGYLELTQLRRIAVTVDEPRVQDLLESIEQQTRDRVQMALRIGEEQGAIRAGLDPDYVAFCWFGLMQAGSYREALAPGSFRASERHIAAWLRTLQG